MKLSGQQGQSPRLCIRLGSRPCCWSVFNIAMDVMVLPKQPARLRAAFSDMWRSQTISAAARMPAAGWAHLPVDQHS